MFAKPKSLRDNEVLANPVLNRLGLPDPVAVTVKANTHVVADTHGFHCRDQARARTSWLES